MGWLAFLPVGVLVAYVLVQLWRDVHRRNWLMATWGLLITALLIWVIGLLLNSGNY